jgi:SagB-type dehydrogenase family enzyme
MRWTGLVVGSLALLAAAQGNGALPEARKEGGMALVEALAKRRSVREYRADRPLTRAELGQLLWAAQGTTTDRGRRTCPSAGALYPLEVYVLTAEGLFHYRPDGHRLEQKGKDDVRGATWAAALRQEAVRRAPAVFVIAAVHTRTANKYGPVLGPRYVHMEAGHAAQNLLLQAVALGLGGVSIGAFHDERLRKELGLPEDHEPLYVIPVGVPA